MRPLQMAGRFAATIVEGRVPDAPRVSSPFRVVCRAASPLAAVAVCGSGKVSGRDESLPYKQTGRFAAMNVGDAPLTKAVSLCYLIRG